MSQDSGISNKVNSLGFSAVFESSPQNMREKLASLLQLRFETVLATQGVRKLLALIYHFSKKPKNRLK